MKIIQKVQRIETTVTVMGWEWDNTPGAGFSFPCDENGVVDVEKLPKAAQKSYRICKEGKGLACTGIEKRETLHTEPAIGRCDCGAQVFLDGFTNTCESCGTDYNWAGQQLADRSQWGEETGESIDDILGIE